MSARLVTLAVLLAVVPAGTASAQSPTFGGGRLQTAALPKTYSRRSASRCSRAGARSPCASTRRCAAAATSSTPPGASSSRSTAGAFSAAGASVRRVAGGRLAFEWTLTRHDLRQRGERDAADQRRAAGLRPPPRLRRQAHPPVRGPPRRRARRRAPRSRSRAGSTSAPAATRSSTGFRRPSSSARARTRARSPRAGRSPRSAAAARASCSSTSRRRRASAPTARSPAASASPSATSTRSSATGRASPAGSPADGASGTLRLRARVFNRSGKRLRTRCDSGTRTWNAAFADDTPTPITGPSIPPPPTSHRRAAPARDRRLVAAHDQRRGRLHRPGPVVDARPVDRHAARVGQPDARAPLPHQRRGLVGRQLRRAAGAAADRGHDLRERPPLPVQRRLAGARRRRLRTRLQREHQ